MRTITRTSSTLHRSTIHVERACNGCGRCIGQPTKAEMEAAIAGAALPDVTNECWDCRPRTVTEDLADQVLEAAVSTARAQLRSCDPDVFFPAYLTLWHAGESAALLLETGAAA